MLVVTFATWQLSDLSFAPAVVDVRNVPGSPGLIIINQLAWCCDGPLQNSYSFYYRGLAHVRRFFITGWIDCRLVAFTAVPCPFGPRMHMDIDWVYFEDGTDNAGDDGAALDDMLRRGTWCVPLMGTDEQGSQPCFFGDVDSSSSDGGGDDDDDDDDDDGTNTSGDDNDSTATPPDDGEADSLLLA